MKFAIENATCGHCVRAIDQAIKDADATAHVDVDLAQKQVSIESSLVADKIIAILGEEGYPARQI